MRTRTIFLSFVLIPSLIACLGRAVITTGSGDASPTGPASSASTAALSAEGEPVVSVVVPSPPPSKTSLPTSTPAPEVTVTPSLRPLVPPQANLASQCLEVLPELPSESGIEGILVLDSRLDVNGRFARDTFLLDLATGDIRQIANVTLTRLEQGIRVQIRWHTNRVEEYDLPLPILGTAPTPAPVVQRIRELYQSHTDQEVAQILNQEGLKTAVGNIFTTRIVSDMRRRNHLLKQSQPAHNSLVVS